MLKKYHLYTLGCQQNHSDSERLASVMSQIGYQYVADENEADVVVINSCAIRQTSMDRIYGRLKHWRPRQKKGELKTVLTGCVLKHDKEKLSKEFDIVLDIKDIGQLPELLGEGRALDLADYFAIPPQHDSGFSAYVPIMTGCDNFCSYCAVPYTRGREKSRPVRQILDEVRQLVSNGFKEIWLLGQNVNSYAGLLDKTQEKRGLKLLNKKEEVNTTTFPELLAMVAEIPGDFWIRFTSPHPYDMSDQLIETIAKYDKITNYINLPFQSGDDEVLKRMNRHYTVKHYLERIKKIRQLIKPVAISTDVIVGFSGETKEQFERTAELMKKVGFDMAYISKYSVRSGTVSSQKFSDDVSKEEKTRRDEILNEILRQTALEKSKKCLGKTVRVLVNEVKEKDGLFVNIGKSDLFKTTLFKAKRSYRGEFVPVTITAVKSFCLEGELYEKK